MTKDKTHLLNNFLTKTEVKKLELANIQDIYSLITYLPFDLRQIRPFDFTYINQEDWFLADIKLLSFTHNQSKQPFFKLLAQLDTGKTITIYWFVRGKWPFEFLKVNQFYQILVSYKNPFYNLVKITVKKETKEIAGFELGKAKIQSYVLPKYNKLGTLSNVDFLKIHQKLPKTLYLLNLNGLLPKNKIIPDILDMAKIHKPRNKQEFLLTLNQWTAFNAFLKMSLIKSLELEKKQEIGLGTSLNKEFLSKLDSKLPFKLSFSQKNTIWQILQEL
jgi:RecG-like helicase